MKNNDYGFTKKVVYSFIAIFAMALLGGIVQISSGMKSFVEHQKEQATKSQIGSTLDKYKTYKVTKLNIEEYNSIFATYRKYYVTAESGSKVITLEVSSKEYYSLSEGDMVNLRGEKVN